MTNVADETDRGRGDGSRSVRGPSVPGASNGQRVAPVSTPEALDEVRAVVRRQPGEAELEDAQRHPGGTTGWMSCSTSARIASNAAWTSSRMTWISAADSARTRASSAANAASVSITRRRTSRTSSGA